MEEGRGQTKTAKTRTCYISMDKIEGAQGRYGLAVKSGIDGCLCKEGR